MGLPPSPASIGRFEVIGRLGQGAQSIVYLGYDPQLHREVALKTVHLEQNDARRAALLREARAVSRLSHPGIVPVFEALETEDGSCLVFEYVAGNTLAERIDESGAMSAVEAVALLLPVLDAVAYAHSHRIVHRDLKPSNILLDDAGRPRVMDFGIAVRHDVGPDDDDDRQVAMLGTPAYMAPEYAGAGSVSPAMDVFAAGLILYELLCGQRAVGTRDGVQAIRYLLNQDVRLPDEISATVGEALSAILHRALARDPGQRQKSMSAFADELRDWLYPVEKPPSAQQEMARSATLDSLLARVPRELEFPLRPGVMEALHDMRESAVVEPQALVDLALCDVSLMLSLIRRANTTEAQAFAAAPVASVTAAVRLLGVAAALQGLSRQLCESDAGPEDVGLAEEQTLALFCGLLSRELSGLLEQDGEEACLAGVLQRLGRLSLMRCFPREAAIILARAQDGHGRQEARAHLELGVGLEDLAQALARQWNLPEALLRCVHAARPGELPTMPGARGELLRAASSLAAELTDALMNPGPARDLLGAAVRRYEACLCLSEREARAAMVSVATQMRAWPKGWGGSVSGAAFQTLLAGLDGLGIREA